MWVHEKPQQLSKSASWRNRSRFNRAKVHQGAREATTTEHGGSSSWVLRMPQQQNSKCSSHRKPFISKLRYRPYSVHRLKQRQVAPLVTSTTKIIISMICTPPMIVRIKDAWPAYITSFLPKLLLQQKNPNVMNASTNGHDAVQASRSTKGWSVCSLGLLHGCKEKVSLTASFTKSDQAGTQGNGDTYTPVYSTCRLP
eukprot:1161655-Pelagomonas_calceolata.AAC.11